MRSLEYIEAELRARIDGRYWVPGTLIPGRRALAEEFSVDLHTIQRAIAPLVADGTLRVDGGRGTLVGGSREQMQRLAGVKLPSRQAPPAANVANVTVGIVVTLSHFLSHDTSYWNLGVVHGLERGLTRKGGMTIRSINTVGPEDSDRVYAEVIDAVADADLLALICTESESECIQKLVAHFRSKNRPIVCARLQGSRYLDQPDVTYDNVNAGFQAADHLLSQGYNDVVFFCPFGDIWAADRIAGARQAVLQRGAPSLTLRLIDGREPIPLDPSIQVAIAQNCAASIDVSQLKGAGIIAVNDRCALELMRILSDAGGTAGQDYGIVGFDDHVCAREANLTSLHPPTEMIGEQTASLLIAAASGEDLPCQVQLHSHLIARASSGRMRGSGV